MASDATPSGTSTDIPSPRPAPIAIEPSQSSTGMSKGQILSPTSARRRGSAIVKRAASTPNVRALASSDTSSLSLAEKRRNKLGYHRTSVACGHCRRRKIRCLLAAEDPQGRCSNCIRLKKDCIFFPVDQQPPSEKRPRSSSKADAPSNEAATSTSSSPGLAAGHVVEQVDNFHHYQSMPLPGGQESNFTGFGGSTMSPPSRDSFSARPYEYPHGYEPNGNWDASPYLNHSPQTLPVDKAQSDDSQSIYWRPTESPVATGYTQSQYSMTPSSVSVPPSSQSSMDHFPAVGVQDEHSWNPPPPPMRSMSLVSPEDLPPQFHSHFHQHHATDFRRRMTSPLELQPPNSSSNINTSNAPLSNSQQPPHHIPYVGNDPSNATPYNYPPPWNSISTTQSPQLAARSHEGFSHGWYSDSLGLSQVREEDLGSLNHQQHTLRYAQYKPHPT